MHGGERDGAVLAVHVGQPPFLVVGVVSCVDLGVDRIGGGGDPMTVLQNHAIRYGVFSAIGLGLVLCAWMVRRPVVEQALQTALALRGIQAEFQVTALDFGQLVLDDVSIGSAEGEADLSARRVRFDFRLSEVFAGGVQAISAEGMEARARIDRKRVQLLGAPEPWSPGLKRRGAPLPNISLEDLRLHVESPLGELVVDAQVFGDRVDGWLVEADGVPALIGSGDTGVVVERVGVFASLAPDGAQLDVNAVLREAQAVNWHAKRAQVSVALTGVMGDPTDMETLRLSGPVSVRGEGVGITQALAEAAGAALAPEPAAWLSGAVKPHVSALRNGVVDAFTHSDFRLDGDLRVLGYTLALEWVEPVSVTLWGQDRLAVALGSTPVVVDARKGALSAKNLRMVLESERLTNASLVIRDADIRRRDGGRYDAVVNGLAKVSPWDVETLALAVEADSMRFRSVPGGWVLHATGKAGAEGARGQTVVRGLGVEFDVDVMTQPDEVRVLAHNGAGQTVFMDRGFVHGMNVRNVSMRFGEARPGRAFLRASSTDIGAAARLAEVDFTAAIPGVVGGRFRAPAAELSFNRSAQGGARADARLQGPRVDGLLNDNRVARLEARILNLQAQFAEFVTVSSLFQALGVSGDGLPVVVSDAAGEMRVRFDGFKPLDGTLNVARADISDGAALTPRQAGRERFAPVRLAMIGALEGGDLSAEGWIRHAATGAALSEYTLGVDLQKRTGQARLRSAELHFTPGGFQPGDVVARLGEVFPNVDGTVRFNGQLVRAAEGGAFLAPLTVDLADVGFDTNFGRLEGVSGQVALSDAILRETAGPQTVSVTRFDPGLPLYDGSVTFTLPGDGRVIIPSAQFTVAGGQVVIEPMDTVWDAGLREGVARVIAVDMGQVPGLFQPANLRLEGRISGLAPFVLDQRQLTVRGAQLRSDGPGRIRLRPPSEEPVGFVGEVGMGPVFRDVGFDWLSMTADGALDSDMVVGLEVLGGDGPLATTFSLDLGHWVREEPRRGRAFGGMSSPGQTQFRNQNQMENRAQNQSQNQDQVNSPAQSQPQSQGPNP